MPKEQFLYKIVYNDLKTKISQRILNNGEKLDSEEEMTQQYGVSAITVKKALSMLAEEGFIRRVRGKGSFVTDDFLQRAMTGVQIKAAPLIGAVFEHVSSSFGLQMLYEMERLTRKAGYRLFPCFSYGKRDLEIEAIRYLTEIGVSGLLIMPAHGKHYNREILRLVLEDFPIVLIDKKMEGIPVVSVRGDGEESVRKLVRYLAGKGRKKIGFVTVEEADTTTLIERKEGFLRQMEEENLTPCAECLLPYVSYEDPSETYEKIYAGYIREYLRINGAELDGIICAEYGLAMVVTSVMKALGYEKTIELCCIDENYIGSDQYELTHVKQDEKKIASCAVELLMRRIKGEVIEQEDYLIPGIFREAK